MMKSGIFLAFDTKAVETWVNTNEYAKQRNEELHQGYLTWLDIRGLPRESSKYPGLAYIMLHTLSHLLLTEISLDCDYSASAIKERVYAIKTTQKKTRNKELRNEDKLKNKELAGKRIFVEHIIRLLKIFRVAQERFRLSSGKYDQIVMTICGLVICSSKDNLGFRPPPCLTFLTFSNSANACFLLCSSIAFCNNCSSCSYLKPGRW
jgi:hypothetical protein